MSERITLQVGDKIRPRLLDSVDGVSQPKITLIWSETSYGPNTMIINGTSIALSCIWLA
jgi:hypothetical protein